MLSFDKADLIKKKTIFQKSTEREKAASVELFSDLMRSIERCQAELLEMMEEKQKAAEKQEEKAHSRPAAGNHWAQDEKHWAGSSLTHWGSPPAPTGQCLSVCSHHRTTLTLLMLRGFLLSPAVDWSIPVQSSTHQELAEISMNTDVSCGDSEERSDSAAGNSRPDTQSNW